MKIRFLGAAGTVTGSKYLVETDGARVLVDCGLYQGVKSLRLRNRRPLPFRPAELDAVLLTHAHLDHSGHLPALVRDGFGGPVHCTEPTAALCELLLPDSGHIQEEDARYANRKKFSRHKPALPLYTEQDAMRALGSLRAVPFGRTVKVGDLEATFSPAGHILGAASVQVRSGGRAVVFSGDLGRYDDLLMRPPAPPAEADEIVIESTYGDRSHPEADPVEWIAGVLRRTVERGGILLVPSFAVGRAQTILLCLHEAFRRELAPRVPVYVNSPMATAATDVYARFHEGHRLSADRCREVFGAAHFTRSVEASRALAESRDPAVILSASGMATGGRVLHHLAALLPDARHTVLMPGFQAPGTRGDALARGAGEVKIHGRYVPVRAEVRQIDALSAHADQADLVRWLGEAASRPRRVIVTHGEPVPADVLRRRARDILDVETCVPDWQETLEIGG